MKMARYKLRHTEWYKSCPDELKDGVKLTLRGLDVIPTDIGGIAKTVLICVATEPTTNESL
jgi:hypothetical protein